MELIVIISYLAMVASALIIGDRLGTFAACRLLARLGRERVLEMPRWLSVPVSISIPGAVMAIVLGITLTTNDTRGVEVLTGNLEIALIASFFITGVIGGFLSSAGRQKRSRGPHRP